MALAGNDKPALSADDKQLCVEGLKHGERYNIKLRAGLPSAVQETLPKSAEFNIYVRDRKPFVRFSGRAYVLPRTGQRGIPVVSVNTPAVAIKIYRIGDRNLIDTVGGDEAAISSAALGRYELEQLAMSAASRCGRANSRSSDAAQCRSHHGIPGRSGARRAEARRLRHVGAAAGAEERRRRLRLAGDAMVHRLRSRADGVFRQ